MLEIKDTKVYGITESIIASGYAMTTEPYDYPKELNEDYSKHLERAKRLAKCGGGSGHSNFRTGIVVQFDIKYPQYISPEMQRYHFLQIITSQSKMHRLLKMDIDKSCNKYVSREAVNELRTHIINYNYVASTESSTGWSFPLRDESYAKAKTKEEALYIAWMKVISNCPMGLELWMRVSLNYEQLATMYKQRRHHKLREDWGAFCNWIETLPYAKELIICGD